MKLSFRILTLSLAIVLIMTMFATGSGAATSSAAQATQAATQAAPPPPVKLNPDVSGEIDFWHFWASPIRRNGIRRIIAICQQKLPKIKIKDTVKPFGDIWTANIAAVAAGSGMPDVIVEDRPNLPKAAADGIEQSLQKYATRDGLTGAAFWPFTWQQTLYKGETYGIPFETDVRVLFYNKTLFQQAGLDPNTPPKTWDELEKYADKLDVKGADGKYTRIGFFPVAFGNVGEDLWAQTEGLDWTKDNKPHINTPEVADTLAWIKKWYDRYGGYNAVQEFKASMGAAPNDAFMSGKVAMLVDIAGYSSFLNFYRPSINGADGKSVRIDWGVSLPPYKKQPSSVSGGFALSIPTGAKNPDAAWEFIKCATSQESNISWARDTASIPTDVAAANDPVLMADPTWAFFIDAMKVSTSSLFIPGYPNWREQLNQRYEKIYKGELPIDQALKEAQDAVDKTIASSK